MWHIVHKETNKPILINDTTKGFYQSRAAVIRALKTSGALKDLGLCWKDVELRDHWGRTMDWRCTVVIVENRFALRHPEGWYWIHPNTDRIWYKSSAVLDRAWTPGERELARMECRKRYANPGRAGFQLVQGAANNETKICVCRYQ